MQRVFLFSLYLLLLSFEQSLAIQVAIGTSLALLVNRLIAVRLGDIKVTPVLLFGFLTPCLPLFGGNVLLITALFYLIISAKSRSVTNARWCFPYLAPLVASVIVALYFPLQDLGSLGSPTILGAGNRSLKLFPEFISALNAAVTVVVLALLAARWRVEPDDLKQAKYGVLLGFGLAMIALGLQLAGVVEYFPQLNSFWRGQHRYPATLTDPNAFGLTALLSIPIWVWWISRAAERAERVRNTLVALVFLLLATFSGSRSYFLGLILIPLIWLSLKRSRFVIVSLGCVVAGLAALNLIALQWGALLQNRLADLPAAVSRIVDALLIENLNQTFQSRVVFWDLSYRLWTESSANLLFGIGSERFPVLFQDLASRYHYSLGGWVDNANNFYLGTLVELGLVGFVGLIFVFTRFRLAKGANILTIATLATFGLLLLIGPHLHFVEVAVIVAILLADSIDFRRGPHLAIGLTLFALVFGGQIYNYESYSRGVYPWERREGSFARWSAPFSKLELNCEPGRTRKISVRAVLPQSFTKQPLSLSYSAAEQRGEITLKHGERGTIELKCGEDQRLALQFNSSIGWSPASFGARDGRILGFEIWGEPGLSR